MLLLGSMPWVVTATSLTAAERGECLAKDGGSCDTCCQGITGTCKKLTVDGKKGNKITTKLDTKDDCVLVYANWTSVYVTFPRLKLPQLFFLSACRVGRRRRRRDCCQGGLL